ncbi:phage minor capsid protein [Streptomyces sp. NBC_01808]|uniref:phage minor capsid protein n=1 Tax=Streptomyces sp. NBC_01808 TaxID=2975947 RepID=UPI002DD8D89E|nr:phage minor capsid protein [Streptomyces sp. NBC_01808]WSA39478.1 phage minor capsid protein [Streptomyces sp. NBC_01808]
MVEPLAERTRDLYAAAEERLLGIIARQLADGLEAPGWAERKLAAVQALRRSAQSVVDELGRAVELEVFNAVAEAYNVGHRAAVAELGALPDDARRLVDEITPQAQAADRLTVEAVDRVTSTHRSILRAVVDGFRAVVAAVTATPLLGLGTRRQATQDAMRAFADRGIRAFVDGGGRRWQLTSYAEMAVRTAVGRAAVEAHMRTLGEAGVKLVVVSDAPRECPLCRPWEGRVLTLTGPPGPHTVEVEHAVDDGRMIPVRVAGSLGEARLAGLQHPNCRHSVSAYTPGITRVEQATSDPEGYEAGQRQRAIERHIRRYKRLAAGAVTPEAKRAANAKVRQWQTAMRDHLAAHPDLRRLRHREQLGAGNLPEPRRTAPAEQVEAARVRSGDALTPSEMSDDQLAAAVRAGTLDERALARAAAELDRRDREQLLAAVRDGITAGDLTAFGDDQLARAVPLLDTESDLLAVMVEMDRRDLAARLPGVLPELARLSDDDLAARARDADPGTLAMLAAEAHRRDLLRALFPGGRLLDDLSAVADDHLAWAMQYANAGELDRIAAEMDRRDAVDLPQPADSGDAVLDLLADRQALADAMAPAPDPVGWGAYADDDVWAAAVGDDQAATAPPAEDEQEERRITRREARALYDEYVYTQYLRAEEDCRGELLNRRAAGEGINPLTLFSGPARVAHARASDELREWWAEHGRMTQAEFIEKATGQPQRWAAGARKNESDQQNRR